MAPSVILTRGPRTPDELHALVRTVFGYTIPRHKVCDEHDAPFDAFCAAFFRHDPQVLILGSRGLSGKTRLMSVLGMTFALVEGSGVTVLGGSFFQSKNVHDTMQKIINYPGFDKGWLSAEPTASLISLHNGALIRPITASQRSARGLHEPILLGDEIDEMDEEIWESAKGQPMPQINYAGQKMYQQTVMASTLQYPDKTMKHEMDRMREADLPQFSWCYKDVANPVDGWLDQRTIDMKRREVGAERWRVEYDLGEPSIGNRAFDTAAVDAAFIPTSSEQFRELWPINDPEAFTLTKTREYQEYHFEDYRTDRDYVISADWAKEQDWTVITLYDVSHSPARVVHWVRFHHLPWPTMVRKFNTLGQTYRCGYNAIHDATGVGGMVNDYIDERAEGFLMTGQKRDEMLYDYIAAVEHGKVIAPRVREFYEAHKFASTEMLFSRAKEFHLPDEICSMALGWHKVDALAPANLSFEALTRDAEESSAFEKAISENKPPIRAQDPDRVLGEKQTDPVVSFVV